MRGQPARRLRIENARVVLEDEVISGSVRIEDGVIADISAGGTTTGAGQAVDAGGAYLIPGLIELHTDHLESHYAPRPRVRWNPKAAVLAHDAQIAAAGVTTVFDALRAGSEEGDHGLGLDDMIALGEAVTALRPHLRAEHFVHARCEVSAPSCVDELDRLCNISDVRVVSLMDHAPGQRQFADTTAFSVYCRGKLGMTEAEYRAFYERRVALSERWAAPHRQAVARRASSLGALLASHDDATPDHVTEAAGFGVTLSEFPTTIEAARSAKDAGLSILMGAPNLMRGGSHSGNVAARELADADCLDVLSSDYIPYSLLQGAFALPSLVDGLDLATAIAKVTANPARLAGLTDRGRIAPGLRADLALIELADELPILRMLWREGSRVA